MKLLLHKSTQCTTLNAAAMHQSVVCSSEGKNDIRIDCERALHLKGDQNRFWIERDILYCSTQHSFKTVIAFLPLLGNEVKSLIVTRLPEGINDNLPINKIKSLVMARCDSYFAPAESRMLLIGAPYHEAGEVPA